MPGSVMYWCGKSRKQGPAMRYTVTEVLERLKAEDITKSEQVVRRWLRSGKLKGEQTSRKKGWQMEQRDLEAFIRMQKSVVTPIVTKEERDTLYQKGFADGRRETISRLLLKGFGERATVRKSILRYYVERDLATKARQTAVLNWIFGKRSEIHLRMLDGYVWLYDAHQLAVYESEEQMAQVIAEMARKKVIAGVQRISARIG